MMLHSFHVTIAYKQSHIYNIYIIYIEYVRNNRHHKDHVKKPQGWTMACTDSLTSCLILDFSPFEIIIIILLIIQDTQKSRYQTFSFSKKMGDERSICHLLNRNSWILKWRYVSTIFLAIFCGDIPLHIINFATYFGLALITSQDSTTLKTGPSFGGAWQGGKAKGQPPGQYLTWRISFNDLPIKKQMLALKYHRVYEIREIPWNPT